MSVTKPFFSIVIPLHNKEPHIARALSSVFSQSCSDFEIIIIDDASTDGSVDVVSNFTDKRIKLLSRNTPGPGGYAARNMGIRNAQGQYIAFLDADDCWNKDHLSSLKLLAQQFPKEQFLSCGWVIMDEEGEQEDPYYHLMQNRGNHCISLREYLEQTLSGRRPVHTVISCAKNNNFITAGLFPEEKKAKRGGDLHAWLKMVCSYRSMAWSSHIGGIYYKNNVNMVTRTALSSTHLLKPEIYNELADGLDKQEKLLLRKYFNRRLKIAWVVNFNRRANTFFLPSKLFWRGDFINALRFSIRSFLPRFAVQFVRYLRKLVRGSR